MITIIESKNSDMEILDVEGGEHLFELPANDNINALAPDEIDEIANDNVEGIDPLEIGLQINKPCTTEDETSLYVNGDPQTGDVQELDFSEKRDGTRGYLSEDGAYLDVTI